MLLALPLCPAGTVSRLNIPVLNELPYIRMTFAYLNAHLRYDDAGTVPMPEAPALPDDRIEPAHIVTIYGGGRYIPYNGAVTGDFSSAAFPACAADISGGAVSFDGARLDFDDEQGDKVFFDFLKPGRLPGTLDLNATPDLLPITAVLACYRQGETRLVNAAHARIKETDRIAVMCAELSKLGADISERPDGLVIRGGKKLTGGAVDGHGDHRVVMALAVAALGAAGPVTIRGAEAADVTYPGFLDTLVRVCL
jgi:3-phosphoshikimate 1-carboxyvinyltransferase